MLEAEGISRRDFFGYAARRTNIDFKDFTANMPVDYEDFLKILADVRYNVCPIVEYDSSFRQDKVNVLLRHDLDYDNGYGMLELDYNHGFRSTSYLRLHAVGFYTIQEVTGFYQLLEKYGFEVGYHYEVVDLTMNGSQIDWDAAEKLFGEELRFLREFFNVRSVCPHGGFANQPSLNYEFEEDESRLVEFGVFSAYKIPFSREVDFSYMTDTSSEFVSAGLDYFKEGLEKAESGDVVEILVHPQPGRWNYKLYPNRLLPTLTPRTFQMPTTSTTLATSNSSTTSSTTSTSTTSSTSSILTSMSTSSDLSSVTGRASAAQNSVPEVAMQFLAVPIGFCALGALVFYKIYQRKQEMQHSRKFCTNCDRELVSNSRFCDKCGRPRA